MQEDEEPFQPRWRTCANCRRVRFLEPYVVVDGHKRPLYVTACSQCRRRTERWIDAYVAERQAQTPTEGARPHDRGEL